MPHLCALKFQEPTVNETDRRQLNCAFQVDMTDNVQGGDGCPVTVTWSMNGSTFEITETEVTFVQLRLQVIRRSQVDCVQARCGLKVAYSATVPARS